jgi:hypothetical protein
MVHNCQLLLFITNLSLMIYFTSVIHATDFSYLLNCCVSEKDTSGVHVPVSSIHVPELCSLFVDTTLLITSRYL